MTDRMNVLNTPPRESAGIDGLRERAASALEGALGFVEREGNAFARLRARILVELEPIDRGIDALAAHQRADGGVEAFGQVLPAPLDHALRDFDPAAEVRGTLEALSVLSDWRRLYEDIADRAVDALHVAQGRDGSFGPSGRGDHERPPWRAVTTALLAGFLGRTRSARPEMLHGAGAYLADHWSVEAIRRHGWPAAAAFAHYFTNTVDEQRDAALPWCAREIERGWLAGETSAGLVMRALFYCEAQALPGVTFDAEVLLARMIEEQNADGSAGDGEGSAADRVATTLDAMLFILRICRASDQ